MNQEEIALLRMTEKQLLVEMLKELRSIKHQLMIVATKTIKDK